MQFGPVPPKQLPVQDSRKVLLLGERWQRASAAHTKWAETAKEAYDFFEGRHYTEAQLAELKRLKRPALKFPVIAPIVRLVAGYMGQNRTDITFSPGHDSQAEDAVAETLTNLEKAAATDNLLEFKDAEVFLDGIVGGRGFLNTTLDFEANDLGEVKTVRLDPFSVKIDPDASTYDLDETASYVMTDKMVSVDEIEGNFGKTVAELVRPWTLGQTPLAPLTSVVLHDEVAPVRYFGQREDATAYWDDFYAVWGDCVDPFRKTMRMIEAQYKVREPRMVFIDLETGDKKVLPETWGRDKIEKALLYAEQVGNPCTVEQRMVERLHWTTLIGDIVLYDAPSFYDGFTMTPYFPYFRDGVTRGMVEDLIDSQKEKNKRRSSRIENEAKTARGGWKFHQDSLTPVQERNLKKFGSSPGFNLKWKGEHEPTQIEPNQPPVGTRSLEEDADADIRRISGVNEAALGDVDNRATSGKAIEARQRQAVISVQTYMDQYRRTKHLLGRRHLSIFQNFYTEQRIYRVTGEDGKRSPIVINQMLQDPASGAKKILNDITLGKYSVVVDDAPLSATFAAAQFDEMMLILEKLGPMLGPMLPKFADLILGMSSLPRKQEWVERIQQLLGGEQKPPPAPPPKESINFKDLTPDGKVQMAAQAGIRLDPTQVAVADTIANAPKPAAEKPAGKGNVVPMARS